MNHKQGWCAYWHEIKSGPILSSPSFSSLPAIDRYWDLVIAKSLGSANCPRILELACGDGALASKISGAFQSKQKSIFCQDIAFDAIGIVKSKNENVNGVVSDALHLPFKPRSFDLVISQFGIEYAGLDAIFEAGSMVSSGGYLALLLHHQDGLIHLESSEDVCALEELQKLEFLDSSISMFEAALQGDGDKFYQLEQVVANKYDVLEGILDRFGVEVCGRLILQVYQQVARAHDNITKIDVTSVVRWLRKVATSIPAYEAQMRSMCHFSLSLDDMECIEEKLVGSGFCSLEIGELSNSSGDMPVGWTLLAQVM